MIKKFLSVLVVLPAVLFVVTGVRWLVDPAGAAPTLGLVLDQGLGLSSQVGDLSSFFLTLGMCMLIAVITGRRTWYYPPMLLLSLAAIGRLIAWLVHDAALAPQILVELLVVVLLVVASRRLPREA